MVRSGESELAGTGGRRTELATCVVPPAEHLVPHRGAAVRVGTGARARLGRAGVGDHDGRALADHRVPDHPGVEQAGQPAPAQHLDLHPLHVVGELGPTAAGPGQLALP